MLNWLSPVVQVLHTLSGVLGASITLESLLFLLNFRQCCQQVPFEPARAIFAGIDVLIAVRTFLRYLAALPHS